MICSLKSFSAVTYMTSDLVTVTDSGMPQFAVLNYLNMYRPMD